MRALWETTIGPCRPYKGPGEHTKRAKKRGWPFFQLMHQIDGFRTECGVHKGQERCTKVVRPPKDVCSPV